MKPETGRRLTEMAHSEEELAHLAALLCDALQADSPDALVGASGRLGERTILDGRFDIGAVLRRFFDAIHAPPET